jgi:Cu/Ag efflux protein CusF
MSTTRLIVILAVLTFAASSASAQQMRGSIEKVDELHGSITVQRAPEGTVGASGTIGSEKFAVQDGLLFNAIREGDKVVFTVQEINGVNTITKLQKE